MSKKVIYIFIFWQLINCIQAQDPQVSMFYAISQYISPAFAGTGYGPRLALNHRQQWPGNQSRYSTSFLVADTYFPKYNMGLGLISMHDEQGSGLYIKNNSPTLKTTDLKLQASYEAHLKSDYACRFGIGAGLVNRKLVDNFLFPNQLNNQGPNGQSSDESISNMSVFYPDISAGILLFSPQFWLGAAIDHLNRPNYSFLNSSGVKQDIKGNLHIGYKIDLYSGKGKPKYYLAREKEYSLSPIVHYRFQKQADQFDLGLAGIADQLLYGIWYRGLPIIKDYNSRNINSESIIIMFGWVYYSLNFNYAYDFQASKLTGYTNGSHEINIAYVFKKKKSKFKYRRLPCPNHLKDTHWDINRQHDHQ